MEVWYSNSPSIESFTAVEGLQLDCFEELSSISLFDWSHEESESATGGFILERQDFEGRIQAKKGSYAGNGSSLRWRSEGHCNIKPTQTYSSGNC